jgi:ECF transporter S component (folate family)
MIFSPGLYFPGFTFSAFVAGIIYGSLLHEKQPSMRRVILACTFILLFVDLFLNTIWLTFLYHKAAQTFLLSRLIKGTIMLPIQSVII